MLATATIIQNNEGSSHIPTDLHRRRKTPILHREQFVRDKYPLHELEPLQPILDPILRQHIQDHLYNFLVLGRLVQRHQIGLANRSLPDLACDLGELDGIRDDDGQEV